MTGSLQIKKEYYYMAVNVYVDGKRKVKWIATGIPAVKGNKRKAEQLLNKTLVELEEQLPKDPTQVNVEKLLYCDLVQLWLDHIEPFTDVMTFHGYERLCKRLIIPYFKERKTLLVDLDRKMIQTFIDGLSVSGNQLTGKGFAPTTILHVKSLISLSCKYAVLEELIPVSPCQNVSIPKRELSAGTFYNQKQLNELFEALKKSSLYPIIKFTVIYGLRRSELLGLRWDAIDYDSNTFVIRRVITYCNAPLVKDKTKNKSSHRSFPLTPEVIELLDELKKKQEENRILFGSSYVDSGYVFTKPDGSPINPVTLSASFSRQLEENKLPHIRFHDLRHTCASYLLNSGFTLKDVQEWMGHSNISTTANIYGHIDAARKQTIAAEMSGAFLKLQNKQC